MDMETKKDKENFFSILNSAISSPVEFKVSTKQKDIE